MSDFNNVRSSRGSGIGHTSSPTWAADATIWATASSVPIRPAYLSPRAIRAAPVSVAASMMRSGLVALAACKPSAMTSRPSASVLRISTVLPPKIVMTSLGREALPLGIFSARHRYAVMAAGEPRAAAASVAAAITAAPVMSYFMPTIALGALRESPPESKVIPLPTNATCRVGLPGW